MHSFTRFALVPILAALACGPGSEPPATTPPGADPASDAPSISGVYAIEGETVEVESGQERAIMGRLVLAQEGRRYRSTFDLETRYPTRDGPVRADVIGNGEGSIDDEGLHGQAETQLVMASVPGVDTSFAFVPRTLGPRIVSTTVGRFQEGILVIEIESQGLPGEEYPRTRTTLRGRRLTDDLADVAAPPRSAPDR